MEEVWIPVGTGEVGWDKEKECGWTNVIEWNINTREYRTVTVYNE